MAQLKSGSTVGGQTIATTAQIGSAGATPYKVSFFNSSGTWTRGNLTNHVQALVLGGGGGGSTGDNGAGGAGGGGAHVVMNSAQAGSSRAVGVGGGGSGSYNSGSGGQSNFGTGVNANGGQGGNFYQNGTPNGGTAAVNASCISSDVVTGGTGGRYRGNSNGGSGRWAPGGGQGRQCQCGEDCQCSNWSGRGRDYPHPDGMGSAVGTAGFGGTRSNGQSGRVAVVEYTA